MTHEVIRPDDVPVPKVDCDALEAAATNLRSDGTDVAQAGQDIKSSWEALEGVYSAPEAPTLFAAINPVATKGDDFDSGASSVADALADFAAEVRPIKARLKALKADAEDFQEEIAGDDDWREDQDKIDELDQLNNDILAAMHDYQRAERDCANAITALFDGTTFVATAPGEEGSLGPNEQAHGFTDALSGVKTPWATPQEHDAEWYVDVWDGVQDFGVGIAEDLGSMVGLYGDDGWGVSSVGAWGNNLADNWTDTLNGLGSLVGLYGEDGWGVGSGGQWWDNFSSGWTEFAHAVVPWREWGDRPGYVITQSVLNIGSMFVGGAGVYKALASGARKVGGGSGDVDVGGRGGDADVTPDMDALRLGDGSGRFSVQGLQNKLDGLDIDSSTTGGLQDALSRAENFGDSSVPSGSGTPNNAPADLTPAIDTNGGPQLQPAGGRVPDIQANTDGPPSSAPKPDTGSPDPSSLDPKPSPAPDTPERPSSPSSGPGGSDQPGSGNPPEGGGGDRPPVPRVDAERGDGGERPDGDAPEPKETDRPEIPEEDGPDGQEPANKDGGPEGVEEPVDPNAPDPTHEPESKSPDGDNQPDSEQEGGQSGLRTNPLPPDFTRSHVLEQLDESRVTRGDAGLIETVDGRPVNSYMRAAVTDRADFMRDSVEQGEHSKADLGKTRGAVNSIAIDLRTGRVTEGINGRVGTALNETDLHAVLGERLRIMEEEGPYTIGEPGSPDAFEHIHPTFDDPLRHAEIKALNGLLEARGESATMGALKEFRVDNLFTLRHDGPEDAHCCGSCTRLLGDTSSPNAGKTFTPQGQSDPEVFHD
ncbi:YwqJ-related putative deaminase [Streptomonospora litoralis]|uniref:YwqJ-like deaminase n=1 Tax=Streptomonospora litoralis TaxID=2498135 RepID=A0A4P6Q491_9ACTN|nr:YwqJ-related putative deaminase [Streptomonospora litoralis]QBI54131.1 hypothetical protein EKD16_11740 [Streptomonospora litoralis]